MFHKIHNITLQFYQHAHSHKKPIDKNITKDNKFAKLWITLTTFEFNPPIFFSLSAATGLPSHTSINEKQAQRGHTRGQDGDGEIDGDWRNWWRWRWTETQRGKRWELFEQREREWVSLVFNFHLKKFNSKGQSRPRLTPFKYGSEIGLQNSFHII